MFNVVGHGKSEGDRVHINCFKTYFDDVIKHVEDTKAEYPDVPCFLMGHSNVSVIIIMSCACSYIINIMSCLFKPRQPSIISTFTEQSYQ